MDKGQFGRRDRLVQEKSHDTYKEDGKWPEPTLCTGCSAVFAGGRWSWKDAPDKANTVLCPACQRINDNFPAGTIDLAGSFYGKHREEILNLIRNEEKLEKGEHPLERIIHISETEGGGNITTTGIHIASRIGKAIHRAYQGELSASYGDGEKTIRISWSR
ncbi:MAG: ATPase [Desulfobulbaceae bacterium]|uniref:ATPase n=1 Tax=Candidatus Desulfatifera sulfidica TaxID=2841691 RepID=A0A8J6N948_9BACT|nr:ATPase [Candidatus Desulfatifera sulfidica]